MALAQETPLLLLDEPTTFLDIAHQMEVLDLCAELHEQGRTLVAVLHDLNHACRYATHLIAMRDGAIVAAGRPARDRRRRAGRVRVRAAVPRRAVPRDRRADGRARRATRAVSGAALLRATLRGRARRRGRRGRAARRPPGFEALVPGRSSARRSTRRSRRPTRGALVLWLGLLGGALRVPRRRRSASAPASRSAATERAAHDLRMRLVARVLDPRGGGEGGRLPGELRQRGRRRRRRRRRHRARRRLRDRRSRWRCCAGAVVLLLTSLQLGLLVLVGLPAALFLAGRLARPLSRRAAEQQSPRGRRGRRRHRPRRRAARAAGDRRRRRRASRATAPPAGPRSTRRSAPRAPRPRSRRARCSSAGSRSRRSRSSAAGSRRRATSRSAS